MPFSPSAFICVICGQRPFLVFSVTVKGSKASPMLMHAFGLAVGILLHQNWSCATSITHRVSGGEAIIREETTMTIGQIAQRLQMGTRNTLSAKPQERKAAST